MECKYTNCSYFSIRNSHQVRVCVCVKMCVHLCVRLFVSVCLSIECRSVFESTLTKKQRDLINKLLVTLPVSNPGTLALEAERLSLHYSAP